MLGILEEASNTFLRGNTWSHIQLGQTFLLLVSVRLRRWCGCCHWRNNVTPAEVLVLPQVTVTATAKDAVGLHNE